MKKSILFLLAFVALGMLQSCQKEDVKPVSSDSVNGSVIQYCSEIDDYVTENYPNATIESVVIQDVATAAFVAEMHLVSLSGTGSGDLCLLFDMDCVFAAELNECP